jgi:hypothetical protein
VLIEGIGTSLIEDIFDNLIDSEATELIEVVGYVAEQIMEIARPKPRPTGQRGCQFVCFRVSSRGSEHVGQTPLVSPVLPVERWILHG